MDMKVSHTPDRTVAEGRHSPDRGLPSAPGDIADLQRVQEELGQSPDHWRILFECTPDALFLSDAEGTCIDANSAAERLCGYPKKDLVGRNLHDLTLLPGNQSGQTPEPAGPNVAGPPECCLSRKDGTPVQVEVRTHPVPVGEQTATLSIVRNIGERKQAQAMLEALNGDLKKTVEELERSNQELRDFAQIAAHELKAPLRGIATVAGWVAQDSTEKVGEKAQQHLGLLQQRIDHMTQLIDGILRYSQIAHGDHSVEMVDMDSLAKEVIEQSVLPEHIHVRIETPLPVVPCERPRLIQVLQNLIGNAARYVDKPQGEIRIAAVDEGDFWKFSVTDNGPGIPERHFGRIFQMFQTLEDAPEGHETTGLGLALVKKIVEMHNGRVWVESTLGQGSTFHFTLPNIMKGRKMKNTIPVLLVEDDAIDAMTVHRAFRDLKLNNPLNHVTNGEEALEYLRNEENPKPCVILLDLNMPRMNGVEFMKLAKADPAMRRIPIIVLTTSRNDRDIIDSYDLSVAGYIVKPVDYKKFVEAIRTIDVYWTISELPAELSGGKSAECEAAAVA
jgi:two-component system sensor kinase FixL